MATPIAPVPVCWPLSPLAETVTSDHASAACYRASKHIGVVPVVIAELKFRDVQRQIFGAHFVERADHAALEDRPEALNRVGVNCTDHILALAVINGRMIKFLQIVAVVTRRVGRQQTDFVRDGFIDEIEHGLRRDALQNSGDYVALALNRTDDWRLVAAAMAYALIPVAIVVLAANPRLVHFHDAAKPLLRRDQARTDFVAHRVRRLVTTEAKHALNLEGAHSLLAGKHQMGDAIPVSEGLFGVLENRASQAREPIAVRGAFPALPVKRLVARSIIQVRVSAAWAMDAFRPAPRHKVLKAGLIVPDWKAGLKLSRGHLRDWFRALCHDVLPLSLIVGGYCHG
jgi:hypothetical protein